MANKNLPVRTVVGSLLGILKTGFHKKSKDWIDRLLLAWISLAGIARIMGVSASGFQLYVNKKYQDPPTDLGKKKQKGRLTLQCDKLWSFVMNKAQKKWVWLALDTDTKEIVSVYIGDRSQKSAQGLWYSLPPVYRQCAVYYTDFWGAYHAIFPKNSQKTVDKKSGKTNKIERFNCTLRQRISRLVRKTLSFSKKIENYIGAIWYVIHHYNQRIVAAPTL